MTTGNYNIMVQKFLNLSLKNFKASFNNYNGSRTHKDTYRKPWTIIFGFFESFDKRINGLISSGY